MPFKPPLFVAVLVLLAACAGTVVNERASGGPAESPLSDVTPQIAGPLVPTTPPIQLVTPQESACDQLDGSIAAVEAAALAATDRSIEVESSIPLDWYDTREVIVDATIQGAVVAYQTSRGGRGSNAPFVDLFVFDAESCDARPMMVLGVDGEEYRLSLLNRSAVGTFADWPNFTSAGKSVAGLCWTVSTYLYDWQTQRAETLEEQYIDRTYDLAGIEGYEDMTPGVCGPDFIRSRAIEVTNAHIEARPDDGVGNGLEDLREIHTYNGVNGLLLLAYEYNRTAYNGPVVEILLYDIATDSSSEVLVRADADQDRLTLGRSSAATAFNDFPTLHSSWRYNDCVKSLEYVFDPDERVVVETANDLSTITTDGPDC